MTTYYKAQTRLKMGTDSDLDASDLIYSHSSESDSDTVATHEVCSFFDFTVDELDSTGVLLGEDRFSSGSALIIIDNTQSDYPMEFIGWSEEGLANGTGWSIPAGQFAKFGFYIGEGVTKVSCATSGQTCKAKVWLLGEAA